MKRQQKHGPKKRQKRRSGRPHKPKFTAPRTADQFFAMSDSDQVLYSDALNVVNEMRSNGGSLTSASRAYGRDPRIIRRVVRSAFRKKRNGRYATRAWDRLLRVLVIPGDRGNREVATADSRQATLVAAYWNAVDRALSPAEDVLLLRRFEGKYVTDVNGDRIPLLSDLDELKLQYSAGTMSFETIYARRAS